MLYTSSSSWLEPAQISSSQFDLVQCTWQRTALGGFSVNQIGFGFQQGRLCNSDLSGLKLSAILPTHTLKLLCIEVREVYKISRNDY